jgi:ribosomal-protein-alanine N-acetyltransferase
MRYAWGRGIANEAANASLNYAFDVLKLRRVIAFAEPANRASWRVMEKLGMRFEKTAPYMGTEVVWYAIERGDG